MKTLKQDKLGVVQQCI